jgi:hypothetical protein
VCVSVPPYRSGVAGPAYEDLRGPIPSRGHIVRDGHDGVVVAGLVYTGKTEVCKLQQTVRVHKDVPGPISIGIVGKYACMHVCMDVVAEVMNISTLPNVTRVVLPPYTHTI